MKYFVVLSVLLASSWAYPQHGIGHGGGLEIAGSAANAAASSQTFQ